MTLVTVLQAARQQLAPVPEPFFRDDVVGYIRLAVTVILTGFPSLGFLVWWARRGPMGAITKVRNDLNGLGDKVNQQGQHNRLNEQWWQQVREDKVRQEATNTQTAERFARLEENIKRFTDDIHEHHRELRGILEKQGRESLEAIHKLELEVVQLREQANIGEQLAELGRNIAQAIRHTHRHEGEHRA